jgi:ADP-ribose pyrophosphatase YjhB (NUDIX family)/ribosomal protein S18 acetylase RimI-like enzyme
MSKAPTYCPVCGHTLTHSELGGRLRPACDNCGYVHYLNPVPGVGMLIEMDGGVVLIQRRNAPHKHEWTLPSGFVEADESAEEAAIREAEEETGLKVEIIELAAVNSFPEGPPVSGIMIFYRMRPVGGGQLRAGDDALDARVFRPEDMPLLPFRTHREMIAAWLEGQNTPPNPDVDANLVTEKDFVIRLADADDMNEIGALLQLIPANRALTRADWPRLMQRFRDVDGLEVYVAEARQTPPIIIGMVSFASVRSLTSAAGYINDMAVLPAFQRRGVGAALLAAMMTRARRLGLDTLYVDSRSANDQARAFFMAAGFGKSDLLTLKLSKNNHS